MSFAKDKNNYSGERTNISTDSIKIMAESVGEPDLSDESLEIMSESASFVLKLVIQDSLKFLAKNNHTKLSTFDVECSMKIRGIEPLLGFYPKEPIPFRTASGSGGRDIFFPDDKELNLNDLVNASLPKVPLEVSIKPHWLSVEGVQPFVPENPVPWLFKQESSDGLKTDEVVENEAKKIRLDEGGMKEQAMHDLSLEQQLFLKEVTEACVGNSETKRAEALNSLVTDTGLSQLLPRLCTFISEGVKVNIIENNLAMLIYLMRMIGAIIENRSLDLEKYLHILVPNALTCVLSKQLCSRPDIDNHWALRDFGGRLVSQICKEFNSSTNELQKRVTSQLLSCIQNNSIALATHYGALFCLSEMGPDVIKAFIMPHLPHISTRLSNFFGNTLGGFASSSIDKLAASHIKNLLLKIIPPVIKETHQLPDNLEEYMSDYGSFFGQLLHMVMGKYRHALQPTQQTNNQARSSLISSQRPQFGSLTGIGSQLGSGIGSQIGSHLVKSSPRNNSPLASGNNRVLFIAPSRATNPQNSPSLTGNPQVVQLFKGSQNSVNAIKTNFIQKQ